MKKFKILSFFGLVFFLGVGLIQTSHGAIKNIIHEGDSHATLPAGVSTLARTDAAQTFTGIQTFSSAITGTISTNANLTGPITSVGNATSVGTQTGTGSKFVMDTSPVLVTPDLGTPSAGTLTSCTFPTLNQNTTGSAATLTTPRTINGVNFDGSANIVAGVYSKTASNVTTTGQSLVDVTGLGNALLINSTYAFEAALSVASSEATNGCEYGIGFTGAGATVESQIHGTLSATSTQTARISGTSTATPAFVTSASDGGILIKGIVVVGATAGTLTVQHLKVTAGTSTVYGNSYLKTAKVL